MAGYEHWRISSEGGLAKSPAFSFGRGWGSAAQEPQPAQEDTSTNISEPSPLEPFIFEIDPVIVQEDVVVPEPSPQPEPEPSTPVLDLPISQDPPFAPALDLNDAAQDDWQDQDPYFLALWTIYIILS